MFLNDRELNKRKEITKVLAAHYHVSHCLKHITVVHVLLACPQHSGNQARYLGNIPPGNTPRRLIGDDLARIRTGSLFSYILDTEFPVIYSPRYAFNLSECIATLVVAATLNFEIWSNLT